MPRTSDGGCSALDGSPLPTNHSSGRRKHPQRAGAGTKSWRTEMGAATLLAAGQDGTVALMIHSSCGCRHTTCTRPREATFQHDGRGLLGPQPWLRSCWRLVASEGELDTSLWNVATGVLPTPSRWLQRSHWHTTSTAGLVCMGGGAINSNNNKKREMGGGSWRELKRGMG